MGTLQKLQNSIQTLIIFWPVYPIHTKCHDPIHVRVKMSQLSQIHVISQPETKRTGTELVERFCRFDSVVDTSSGHSYVPGKSDCLIFKVNRDISLLGVTLFGSRNCDYSVVIQLDHIEKFAWIVDCNQTGKFSSACIHSALAGSYYGFDVFFHRPVDIKKGFRYHMKASISGGANSCFGENGQPSVVCSWVRFDFYNSGAQDNNNEANVERGQFPGFLFIVK